VQHKKEKLGNGITLFSFETGETAFQWLAIPTAVP
jgi:hypothetical protein